MFKKKNTTPQPVEEKPKEKPTPAFLREDYPYKAIGDALTDLDALEPSSVYEIKCSACEMAIRSQGVNIKNTWERLQSTGCIGCGSKNLIVRAVDMSAAK